MVGKGDLLRLLRDRNPGRGLKCRRHANAPNASTAKYIINGLEDFFNSNVNYSSFYTVFAVTDPSKKHKGISCFVIERDTPGISVSRHFDKLGQRRRYRRKSRSKT
ncbi:MAG: acyl-CoA dehydrogenase family protein [Chloroflexi bacterium]|uniref:acyl-CoA dehydrogenase family protein n=1 Tax=Candidatus Flexifilum breve TaxID=3140694 RepID=UPI003135F028|nr:acyl-CoA dehydrogenase family protein [Chloroflexota bacterium]